MRLLLQINVGALSTPALLCVRSRAAQSRLGVYVVPTLICSNNRTKLSFEDKSGLMGIEDT